MGDPNPNDGPTTNNVSGETSDSSVQLNVKTLDSQIYSFMVDKKMPVLAFKEKIASQVGVPVNQQRLIFRGRVLKDDHLLSEYQVENGHTLHLVARQSAQTQPPSETSSGDARGNDASYGGLGNRPGQIPHSVLLGTFSVADQGDGMVPDLNRVIGSVLNSIGIGGLAGTAGIGGMPFPPTPNATSQTHQGNGSGGNVGGQNQAENAAQSGHAFQSQPQVVQIPLAASMPIPSFHSPIPDSLNTISVFLSRMEQVLTQNGSQQGTPPTTSGAPPIVESPNMQGLPAVEALRTVLRQAERLLGSHAVASLSNLAGRLEGEGTSPDLSIRSQIQTETVQSGLAMQHLGALFLELGRTLLTFRIGQSPGESSIHSGPAVYISPSGPNPIMAQPFPLQTQSLFSGISGQSNSVPFAPVGVGNAARHVNIHIHAGTSMAPVPPTTGARANNGEPGAAQGRVFPGRNVAPAVPAQSRGIPVSDAAQSVRADAPPDLGHMSSMVSSINSRLRDLMANFPGQPIPIPGTEGPGAGTVTGGEQQTALAADRAAESGGSLPGLVSEGDNEKTQEENIQISKNEEKDDLNTTSKDVSSSSVGSSTAEISLKKEDASENVPSASASHDPPEGAKASPLGLGLGSLDRKKRAKQQKPSTTVDDTRIAQQLLQTLSSRSSAPTSAPTVAPSGQTPPVVRVREGLPDNDSDVQVDAATAMSQALNSPGLDNLLAGVSQQTGFGSPDILRNMMQGLTQNPQIMNAVSQIAQQVDTQDIGDMFSGAGRGQGGGGFDLSRMVQQMMPVVSQVLGQGSAVPRAFPVPEPVPQRITSWEPRELNQTNLHAVAQRIEHGDAPEDIFRAMAENAARLSGNDGGSAQDLSNSVNLANEYLEVLRRDIQRRCEGDSDQDKC